MTKTETVTTDTARQKKERSVLIAMPPALLASLDSVAGQVQESRSAIIREAIRQYLRRRDQSAGA